MSRARRAIAEAVDTLAAAFTVEGLHAELVHSDAGVGLATVYRAVAALTDSGYLAVVGSRSGTTLYARCAGGDHHHHLVCTECGVVAPVDCPLDERLQKAADRAGYTVTAHEVVLYGRCRTCGAGSAPDVLHRERDR